jgi:hypothetical protein
MRWKPLQMQSATTLNDDHNPCLPGHTMRYHDPCHPHCEWPSATFYIVTSVGIVVTVCISIWNLYNPNSTVDTLGIEYIHFVCMYRVARVTEIDSPSRSTIAFHLLHQSVRCLNAPTRGYAASPSPDFPPPCSGC